MSIHRDSLLLRIIIKHHTDNIAGEHYFVSSTNGFAANLRLKLETAPCLSMLYMIEIWEQINKRVVAPKLRVSTTRMYECMYSQLTSIAFLFQTREINAWFVLFSLFAQFMWHGNRFAWSFINCLMGYLIAIVFANRPSI